MKKLIPLCAVAALTLAACSGHKSGEETDSLTLVSQQYEQASSFNDSLLLLMGDIYAGLDSINMQEGMLYNMERGAETVDRRQEIRENLANIRARLQQNRDLLTQMQNKLNSTQGDNKVLKKTIADLQARIEQQDQKISQLTTDLENANAQIAELNTQVQQGQEDLADETAAREEAQAQATAAENLANRVYFAIGTNKELKQNGLLSKKFLGATKVLQGDFNQNYFTVGDKRSLTTINTGGKKVKIWTNVPQNSYEIVGNADGTQSIRITDPASFWSRSPYLIIQVN